MHLAALAAVELLKKQKPERLEKQKLDAAEKTVQETAKDSEEILEIHVFLIFTFLSF